MEQIARAKRFAQSMNTVADRERFEKMAEEYQSELDAPEAAEGQSSAGPTGSRDAVSPADGAACQPQIDGSDATAPTSNSTDDQEPTN
jgi:hypothetical protein